MAHNILYAQSGGVTAVINASACGVIETARRFPEKYGKVFAAKDGILGVLEENLYDLSQEDKGQIAMLRHTPGGAFGSVRMEIGEPDTHPEQFDRMVEVFKAHNIGTFCYNGGGGSMMIAAKIARYARSHGLDLKVIGIPKTIDNDLPLTDTSPGFGSVAKYLATSVREVALDLAAMSGTSTKVFILEVMGRHAGWLAAAAGLAFEEEDSPLLLLMAEIEFEPERFMTHLHQKVEKHGWCIVVAAEGLMCKGQFCTQAAESEIFGHEQLGGLAPMLAKLPRDAGYKTHWAVSDYFQRSARHLSSQVDVDQAYACGAASVSYAAAGKTDVMVVIRRMSDVPYLWTLDAVHLDQVADIEMPVPPEFIREDGYGITEAARHYMLPLIQGEDFPPYRHGLPVFAKLKLHLAPKKLPPYVGK